MQQLLQTNLSICWLFSSKSFLKSGLVLVLINELLISIFNFKKIAILFVLIFQHRSAENTWDILHSERMIRDWDF